MTERTISGPLSVGCVERDGSTTSRVPDQATAFTPTSVAQRTGVALIGAVVGVAGGFVLLVVAPSAAFAAAILLLALAFAGGLLSTWSPCGYSSLSLLRPARPYGARSVLRWLPTFATHAAGYVLGALALGLVLGVAAWLVPAAGFGGWSLALVATVALAYGLHQSGLLRMPYPQRRAQVPHDVRLRYPMWKIGLLYGFALGLNFTTYVRTPILYVVVVAAVASGAFVLALALILALNLGRFMPLTVNALPVRDASVQQWLARNERRAVIADVTVLALSGAALLTIAFAGHVL